jgi:DNA adenine methylase
MTRYHGGKQRQGSMIANIIATMTLNHAKSIHGYCEPFCGMLGVYQHIPNEFNTKLKYKAGDTNLSVIKMWQATQKGWVPPIHKVSEKEFKNLGKNGLSSARKGFIGHQYGYMGRYFKPFDNNQSYQRRKNAAQRVSDIGTKLSCVKFSHGSYEQFSRLKGFVIYCDPPYSSESHYFDESGQRIQLFNHTKFWAWCRKMAKNNIVFISEYSAPSDFTKVWSRNCRTTGNSKTENLYMCS